MTLGESGGRSPHSHTHRVASVTDSQSESPAWEQKASPESLFTLPFRFHGLTITARVPSNKCARAQGRLPADNDDAVLYVLAWCAGDTGVLPSRLKSGCPAIAIVLYCWRGSPALGRFLREPRKGSKSQVSFPSLRDKGHGEGIYLSVSPNRCHNPTSGPIRPPAVCFWLPRATQDDSVPSCRWPPSRAPSTLSASLALDSPVTKDTRDVTRGEGDNKDV
ncbi:hypothetical protein BaRGS_00032074, partial [Batillaria attramentaria]